MPTIVVAPENWLEDDDGNLVCPSCATRRESIQADAGLVTTEQTVGIICALDKAAEQRAEAVEAEDLGTAEEALVQHDNVERAVRTVMDDLDRHAELLDDLDDDDPRADDPRPLTDP